MEEVKCKNCGAVYTSNQGVPSVIVCLCKGNEFEAVAN